MIHFLLYVLSNVDTTDLPALMQGGQSYLLSVYAYRGEEGG